MKKIIITPSLILLFAVTAIAQKQFAAVAWEINFPNNNDYLDKTSFSGGKIEYRHFLKNKHISAGLAMDWSTYEQYLPRQTFQKPDGTSAVTSDFVAQAYQLPFTATVHYYFEGTKLLKPYVGVGLGGQYLQQSLYYNVYVSDDDNWGFVARPELGVIIKTQETFKGWGFLVGAHYSYSTNKTDLLNNDSFKNIGVNVGIIFGE
jgi:opacity protein-like surface antigen